MKDYEKIGKAANLLGTVPSRIKYWQSEGLLDLKRDENNNYRLVGLDDITKLSHIELYRQLGIPVKKIPEILGLNLKNLRECLSEKTMEIEFKINELKTVAETCKRRIDYIGLIERINSSKLVFDTPPKVKIAKLSEDDPEMIQRYVRSNDNAVTFGKIREDDSFERIKALIVPDDFKGPLLWEYDGGKFITCINWQKTSDMSSNKKDNIEKIRKTGYTPRLYIIKFLISAFDDGFTDYFQMWVKVE